MVKFIYNLMTWGGVILSCSAFYFISEEILFLPFIKYPVFGLCLFSAFNMMFITRHQFEGRKRGSTDTQSYEEFFEVINPISLYLLSLIFSFLFTLLFFHINLWWIGILLSIAMCILVLSIFGSPYKLDYLTSIQKKEIINDETEDEFDYKPERKPLTQRVKDKVWNRDGGKCVQCGSNEKLEFDHIIPHSKGGADTYRNLQLLCEPCNRSKSAKIG